MVGNLVRAGADVLISAVADSELRGKVTKRFCLGMSESEHGTEVRADHGVDGGHGLQLTGIQVELHRDLGNRGRLADAVVGVPATGVVVADLDIDALAPGAVFENPHLGRVRGW